MKAIISFLAFIVEGVARALIFLLSTFGLWIPTLFSLLFLIVCAIAKTPFAEVSGIFYVGLTLTMLLSISIAVSQVLRQREKKRREKNSGTTKTRKEKKAEKKKKHELEEQFGTPNIISGYDNMQGYNNGQYAPQGYNNGQYAPQGYNNGQYTPQGYNNGQYVPQGYNNGQYAPQVNNNGQYAPQGYNNGQYAPQVNNNGQYAPQVNNNGQYAPQGYNNGQYAPQGYNNGQYAPQGNDNGQYAPQNNNGGSAPAESLYEQAKRSLRAEFSGYNSPSAGREEGALTESNKPQDEEKPLGVFRTRSDPRMLIYEYYDRYDYWQRTDDGRLEYVRTVTK